jgi:hypothetical protein
MQSRRFGARPIGPGRYRLVTWGDWSMPMFWNSVTEWRQKRKLRDMLSDPRSARGVRSTGQLEKGIAADRATTERLLRAIGATKSSDAEEWGLKSGSP